MKSKIKRKFTIREFVKETSSEILRCSIVIIGCLALASVLFGIVGSWFPIYVDLDWFKRA